MRLTDCDNNLSVSPVFCFQNSLLRSHQKAKMLVLLAGLFVVHIATAIMLFVSTIANVSPSPLFPHPRKDLRNSLVKG
jgi:hypothetical protein